ncbi:error-prone DNA polymerase [Aquibium sp. A9E412]|uniref:error-prone DNA polymerase n=1 Tax=Aquibium sp. A9E412 TaxID=2976767 RepID=UPI0025B27234|nr:error-prone DNA polymerase [Aquibium sp. A9E412]MDN2567404.1 error-prone DNA polymerase [Aquibium sp. A9E412]
MTGTMQRPAAASAEPAYAEFAVQSSFSFLRGASQPEELAVTAHRLGLAALGLADCNTVAGVVRAWLQAREAGLAYHPGCRLVFSDGTPDMLAYPMDRAGWGRLCRMLTVANERGAKGAPDLRRADLMAWGDGLALALLPALGAATAAELALLRELAGRFAGAVWLAAAPRHDGDDRFRLAQAEAMAAAAGVPLMAVNDVRHHAPERRPLQDVMTAIRLNLRVCEAGYHLAANAEAHLKPPAEMARLFRRHPQALAETLRFAGRLGFSLDALRYNYPDEPTESGLPPQAELERLVWAGARRRYPAGLPDNVAAMIAHELATVAELGYARYFLTVHDIVGFARSRGILCQGRGSAANSIICYCLRITDVGPDIIDLLFERFISRERNEPPDIDVDFEHERRDEVIAYIYEKYSARRTALAASVVTYRARSALREVAKAMGLSDDVMTALSGSIWGWSTAEVGEREARAAGLDPDDPLIVAVMRRANEIMDFPRHLSQHVGGFVITRDRLDEIVPIVRTAMDERRMVEWDKDDLEAVGILKIDILALGMLSCLRRAFDLLEDHYGQRLDLATLPAEDPAVYAMIQRADTIGVFQIESRAQMTMLPRLKPANFYDLVIEVAIVRPGPIQGDMVHPYLRRREGKETVDYPRPELRAILQRTLGVPLFQEQAMRIAVEAGGFSRGQADELRRAMATFRRVGTIGTLRRKMIDGMVARGYERGFAEQCFKQIEGFGEYGFPESHAASFALLVYASAWFKAVYPDVFCAAILNAQPMGFYSAAQLVRDAREHGVAVRPVDVNHSAWDCTLEPAGFDAAAVAARHATMRGTIRTAHAVRLGLRQVKGLAEADMAVLLARRGRGYDSVRDLWLRTGLPRAAIVRLAEADAFGSLGLDRRAALWAAQALDAGRAPERLPLFERPDLRLADREPETALPAMPLGEHVVHDYRWLGLSLKAHPLSFLRAGLAGERVVPNAALAERRSGRRLSVAGLVLIRQRPGSAKGVIFMTIEDETGVANIIVWPKVFERFRPVVLGARLVRVTGRLQSASGVIHVVAETIEDLTGRLDMLFTGAAAIDVLSRADEVRRPIDEDRRTTAALKPLHHRLAGARAGRPPGDEGDPTRTARHVMPKGRNFH